MFFRRRTIVDTSLQSQIEALAAHVAKQDLELATLKAEFDRLDLAFQAFRQRVYGWRKGKDPLPGQPESPPAEPPKLDKAAVLRAHRSKQ